ncbi:unnamed protein product, partial [Darwinula stevensoni]
MVGYIGRISQKDNEKLRKRSEEGKQDDPRKDFGNYRGTSYIGKSGIEESYETELHGTTGSENVEAEANGTVVRVLSRKAPTNGNNLILAADIRLQYLVEHLFNGRKGAFVAIEPETGDILAYVSKPNYNPNSFVDGIDPQTWAGLRDDPKKPMLNRPIQATYPPGSTFKPFMAMSALMDGIRKPEQAYNDPGYYILGKHRFRGHATGITNMHRSIAQSSNTYYYILAHDMGIDKLHNLLSQFGFGNKTGIDLVGEKKGLLPSSEWKMKRYKQKWLDGETISVGIGQGYSNFTITQLAYATAIIANKGVVMKPHLVKFIESVTSGERVPTVPKETSRLPMTQKQVDVITNAMVEVNRSGTGAKAFSGFPFPVAGKTGTAQVKDLKGRAYNRSVTPEEFRDHSLFIAFAPADKPKIAMALVVENAGFGAEAAAPIVRSALDYYLLGKLPKTVEEITKQWYRTHLYPPHQLPKGFFDPMTSQVVPNENLRSNTMKNISGWPQKMLSGFDKPLLLMMATVYILGLVTLYSASLSHPEFLGQQVRNILISLILVFALANISPQNIMRLGPPIYVLGVVLLVAVLLFGVTKKGATRWLHVGIDIQPSEIMKIAVPLTIAWYFHNRESLPKFKDFIVASLILIIPALLIAKQPDLGTAILVTSAGAYVIFFAGMSWWLVVPLMLALVISVLMLLSFGPDGCASEKKWPLLHNYQKH